MDREETRFCLTLAASLWTNFKLPQTERDVELTVDIWQQFFSSIPLNDVSRAIMEISAEGTEFAPQVGQIYKRVADKKRGAKAALTADNANNAAFLDNIAAYAKLTGKTPPDTSNVNEAWAWFQEVRNER
jgi:hypothetical protein